MPLPTTVEAKAVRIHGSPPCRVGASMSIVVGGEVRGTLGCAEFDAAAVAAAAEVAAAGEPQTRTLSHDLGEIEVYLEPVLGARDGGRGLGQRRGPVAPGAPRTPRVRDRAGRASTGAA